MDTDLFKQFTFKKFGYLPIGNTDSQAFNQSRFKDFIKVILVKAGSRITVDFKEYSLGRDALFFINAGQWYRLDNITSGEMLYYNRDFYCIEIHDKEVACDGILFHNVYEIPVVYLTSEQSSNMQAIFSDMKEEIASDDSSAEEMLRILLKQIIIKSTRIWKQEHQLTDDNARQELEFIRKFSQLVEWHYTSKHVVSEYADLLSITPKALNKRISKYSRTTPNDIIKNRIILEAKRLLVHTDLSVKEIGYKLGYDDPAYFTRLFLKQTENTPQNFRKQYLSGLVEN